MKSKIIKGEIETEKPQGEKDIGESEKPMSQHLISQKFLFHKGL